VATDEATPDSSLVCLLIRVTRRPPSIWSELTDREAVVEAIEAAAKDERELHALRVCFPDPTLRYLRLRRLAGTFGIPNELVMTLTARVAALPPPVSFPDCPEVGDWAWEQRRELFGR
jgi:Asp/Glu/hydantoin racemase